MKQDRFLIGILVGIGVLVVVALVLFFTRRDQQDYALAVFREDYEKAYSYLADAENKPTYNEFRQAFFNHYVNSDNTGLELGETEIAGDEAFVTVYLIYSSSDPFSSGYRNTDTARLERQDDQWKLLEMPYNFWYYDWYQPEPVKAPTG